jgi:predicted DNA-binding transcriptional regulator AlpA
MNDKTKYLTLSEVALIVPLSKQTIRQMAKSGEFPAPINLSPKKPLWIEAEVRNWLNEKFKHRE